MMKNVRLFVLFLFSTFATLPIWAENPRLDAEFQELQNLHAEISLLNLVNGLRLNDQQMEGLLDILNGVENLRGEYRAELEQLMPEIESAYGALHSDLVDDDLVDKSVEERAARIHGREMELKQSYNEDLSRYEKKVEGILNEKQLSLIEDFEPCLIPPKKAGQSSIGQAGAADSRAEEMLRRVRDMPEQRFDFMAAEMIDRYIDHVERTTGVMSDEERKRGRYSVSELMFSVREMSDLEYETRKAGIIEQFKSQTEKSRPKERKRKGEPGKIARFLLDTSLAPLLEKKLQYSELAENSD